MVARNCVPDTQTTHAKPIRKGDTLHGVNLNEFIAQYM